MGLQGADELRARLNAIAGAGEGLAERWAEEHIRRTRSQINNRTGDTAASLRAEVSRDGARVTGSPVVTYLRDGTQAHEERPVNAKALRFQIGSRTIFSKRVFKPATRGNPALGDAHRDALDDASFADEVVDRWNGAA